MLTNVLKEEYTVTLASGGPVDPQDLYLVIKLNLDGRKELVRAAHAVALLYADMVVDVLPRVAAGLRMAVTQQRLFRTPPDNLWEGPCQRTPLPNLYQRALFLIAESELAAESMRMIAHDVLAGKSASVEALEEGRRSAALLED